MLEFLGTAGAERAERSLSGFFAQVRAALPCPAPSPHQTVLRAGMQTLDRRCHATRAALDAAIAETEAEARALALRIRAALAGAEALNGDAGEARMRDLALQRATLDERAREIGERVSLLRRARVWLDDVRDAAGVLALKDAGHPHGVDAPGLLRTLTELGALLGTMADATQKQAGRPWVEARVSGASGLSRGLSVSEARAALAALKRDVDALIVPPGTTREGEDDGRTV